MGYRIDYGEGKRNVPPWRRYLLSMGAFAVFLGLVIRFWPEGRNTAAEFLFPGGAERACRAVEAFAGELQDGVPLREAVAALCRDILSGAGLP